MENYLEGWMSFSTVLIIVFSWVLVLVCWVGCWSFHSTMADNENSKHILLNIAYEQFAITIQIMSFNLAAKVKEVQWRFSRLQTLFR